MQQVLNDKVALVSLNVAMPSGYRKATAEHIKAMGGLLPACNAITEGSIKVFPVDGTKDLQSIRRSIFRKLQAHGVRALGSQNVFAVVTDDLPEIEKEIATAEADFAAAVASLDAEYDNIFENHVKANATAEAIIRSLKVDRVEAIARCRFVTSVFKISPFVREGESEEDSVEGIVLGLGRQLYEEVAAEMEKLSKNEAFERQKVGQKTLRPIKAAVAKMTKLSFLNPTVLGAVTLIQDTLKSLPAEGYITGQPFETLVRLVDILSDTDELVNAASKVTNGIAACDVLYPNEPVLEVVTEPAPAEEVAAAPVEPTVESVEVPPMTTEPVPAPVEVVATPVVAPVVLPQVSVVKPVVGGLPPLPPTVPVLKPSSMLKPNAMMF